MFVTGQSYRKMKLQPTFYALVPVKVATLSAFRDLGGADNTR